MDDRRTFSFPDDYRAAPKPEPPVFQVWHDRGWPQSRLDQMLGGAPPPPFPDGYFHAADVRAGSLREAVEQTTSRGHVLDGDHRPWDQNRGVRSHTPRPFVPRDTDRGDVIVTPSGRPYRYDGATFTEVARSDRPAAGAAEEQRADAPAGYRSSLESIDRARELLREVRAALAPDDAGQLPHHPDLWDGLNLPEPDTAWQTMDAGQRYDILLHAVNEAIWSLDTRVDADGWRDSQKLALEFVQQDDPAEYERFTREEETKSRGPAAGPVPSVADILADPARHLAPEQAHGPGHDSAPGKGRTM